MLTPSHEKDFSGVSYMRKGGEAEIGSRRKSEWKMSRRKLDRGRIMKITGAYIQGGIQAKRPLAIRSISLNVAIVQIPSKRHLYQYKSVVASNLRSEFIWRSAINRDMQKNFFYLIFSDLISLILHLDCPQLIIPLQSVV